MKSFSSYNLIAEKLNGSKKRGLLRFIESSSVYIKIKVPKYEYIRADALLADIAYTIKDAPKIDMWSLFLMLYLQFINKVRKGGDTKTLGKNIMDKMEIHKEIMQPPSSLTIKSQKTLKKISPTSWKFDEEIIKDEQPHDDEDHDNNAFAYVYIKIKKSELYRGEILLCDIEKAIEKSIHFKVEDLISMLFIDFIKDIERAGNNESELMSIIAAYEFLKKKYQSKYVPF
jgi:hypothetical protein